MGWVADRGFVRIGVLVVSEYQKSRGTRDRLVLLVIYA
jgi:hypothetical protein